MAGYWDIRVQLTDGRWVAGHAVDPACSVAGRCGCGFCKGDGQCQFGDCRNPLPAPSTHQVGTLCLACSLSEWRPKLPGHRASVALKTETETRS